MSTLKPTDRADLRTGNFEGIRGDLFPNSRRRMLAEQGVDGNIIHRRQVTVAANGSQQFNPIRQKLRLIYRCASNLDDRFHDRLSCSGPRLNFNLRRPIDKETAGKPVKEHLILGKDRRDAEAQRDRWLSENPAIKVLRVHPPRRTPPTLLTRLGGSDVPRVFIAVDYEDDDIEKN